MTEHTFKINYDEAYVKLNQFETYTYHILSGYQKTGFVADVCDSKGQVVYRIAGGKALQKLLEDHHMSYSNDFIGLQHYLRKLNVIGKNDYITKGR